jgi:hypothetical protein
MPALDKSVQKSSEDNYFAGALLNNFPNPFNPITKIKFTIPTSSYLSSHQGDRTSEIFLVTLKVYDILGREITTLVDEYKPAGSYEVEFNGHSGEGQNLSSGVYFYQIRIRSPEINSGQGIIQTKKMILMK